MIYLLLGEDLKAKDTRIAAIKADTFKNNNDDFGFDLEALDAHGLPVDTLKKALITLPFAAPKRLVIVRNVHKLKAADMGVLMRFCEKPANHVHVILESSETAFKGELKNLPALCTATVFGAPVKSNIFDMTKQMGAGRTKEALLLLKTFYTEGTHPLQVMGVLVWFWGKEGRGLGTAKFEQGLEKLEAADLNIKRSRLNPEHAVEKVVVELVELLSSKT